MSEGQQWSATEMTADYWGVTSVILNYRTFVGLILQSLPLALNYNNITVTAAIYSIQICKKKKKKKSVCEGDLKASKENVSNKLKVYTQYGNMFNVHVCGEHELY